MLLEGIWKKNKQGRSFVRSKELPAPSLLGRGIADCIESNRIESNRIPVFVGEFVYLILDVFCMFPRVQYVFVVFLSYS